MRAKGQKTPATKTEEEIVLDGLPKHVRWAHDRADMLKRKLNAMEQNESIDPADELVEEGAITQEQADDLAFEMRITRDAWRKAYQAYMDLLASVPVPS